MNILKTVASEEIIIILTLFRSDNICRLSSLLYVTFWQILASADHINTMHSDWARGHRILQRKHYQAHTEIQSITLVCSHTNTLSLAHFIPAVVTKVLWLHIPLKFISASKHFFIGSFLFNILRGIWFIPIKTCKEQNMIKWVEIKWRCMHGGDVCFLCCENELCVTAHYFKAATRKVAYIQSVCKLFVFSLVLNSARASHRQLLIIFKLVNHWVMCN